MKNEIEIIEQFLRDYFQDCSKVKTLSLILAGRLIENRKDDVKYIRKLFYEINIDELEDEDGRPFNILEELSGNYESD
jgi:hypothetical protein